MTTIAYKDGILAVDSQATFGTLRVPGITKKMRLLQDGSIAAGCGVLATVSKMFHWLDTDRSTDCPLKGGEQSSVVIVVTMAGEVQIWEDELPYEHDANAPLAQGSGMEIAYGAMQCGKTAEEAVEIAAELDIYTSLPAQVGRPLTAEEFALLQAEVDDEEAPSELAA